MATTGPDAEAATAEPWETRIGGEADRYLRHRQATENFPVALRVLPGPLRAQLSTVYDVARVIDDLGDEAPGDRTALLLDFRGDLERIWRGEEPVTEVLRRLAGTVRECGLSKAPFVDLIEANLRDQTTRTYATYDDLLAYCALSANPVGHIVLEVFGVRTAERDAYSDLICTALQVIEHCQDVEEDRRAGRVYLPREDVKRFGGDEVCPKLIAFEAERAEELLTNGLPLLTTVDGWARLAIAGYAAGGLAAVDALRRNDWRVVPTVPKARPQDVVRQLASVLARRRMTA